MKESKYKINDTEYQCECGRIFDYFQSLNGHFAHCKIHRMSIGKLTIWDSVGISIQNKLKPCCSSWRVGSTPTSSTI